MIDLPLTIGLGTIVTALLLTDLSWGEAALVARSWSRPTLPWDSGACDHHPGRDGGRR